MRMWLYVMLVVLQPLLGALFGLGVLTGASIWVLLVEVVAIILCGAALILEKSILDE